MTPPTAVPALAVLVAVLAVAALNEPYVTTDALLRAVKGAAGAGAVVVACAGAGKAVLGRLREPTDFASAAVTGAGVLGLLLLPVTAALGVHPWVLAATLLVTALGWLVPSPGLVPGSLRDLSSWAWLLLPLGVVGLLDALAPPVDVDEVYYHLAVPKQLLLQGELFGGPLQPNGSRPLPLALVNTVAFALGGEAGPKLLHLGLAAALVAKAGELAAQAVASSVEAARAARQAAVFVLVGSWSFAHTVGLAHGDLAPALWGLLAVAAARDGRLAPAALWAAMAFSGKYTAAPVVAGVVLVAGWRLGWRAALTVAVAVVAWVAPWWLRNLLQGLHPLFPYAGWPHEDVLGFMPPGKYGAGRGLVDLVLLPWRVAVSAELDSFRFLGRVNLLALVALPGALWVAWRRREPWVAVAAMAFLGWAAGPHILRLLLAGAGVLAVAVGLGVAALPPGARRVAWAAWLFALPANLGPWLEEVATRAPVALGRGSRDALLREHLSGYAAAAWVNEHAAPDDRVALLFAWALEPIDRVALVASVEDHVPSRSLLLTHGATALDELAAHGVTLVIANRPTFLAKARPHLSVEELDAGFHAPARTLDEALLARGELLFEEGRLGVWRLLPP